MKNEIKYNPFSPIFSTIELSKSEISAKGEVEVNSTARSDTTYKSTMIGLPSLPLRTDRIT